KLRKSAKATDRSTILHIKGNYKSMPSIKSIREAPPLIVCITNDVVKNFTANGMIALGASPIMSGEKDEAEALMKGRDGLLNNSGTADGHKKGINAQKD